MVTESVTNTSSTYVVIETTEQMTACDGANLCELRIEDGGDRIGTLNFVMECEKSPDTGITSQTEINNLETLVDGFTALAVADQYDSANVIFDAIPTAGHGNGYAPTSECITLANCLDTTITTPSANQVLAYDGSKWVNGSLFGLVKTKTLEDTTTASGALAHGLDLTKNLPLFATGADVSNINRVGFLRSQGDTYLTVISMGSTVAPVTSTSVKLTLFYI